jgi:hypothetical protein
MVWNRNPRGIIIEVIMKRLIASIITLLFVCGNAGIPLAAYNCTETGENGVVSYLAAPPDFCYAESCCDIAQDTARVGLQGDVGCCDLDVQVAGENHRILPPEPKDGQADPLVEIPIPPGDSLQDAGNTTVPPLISVSHASINLPLLF